MRGARGEGALTPGEGALTPGKGALTPGQGSADSGTRERRLQDKGALTPGPRGLFKGNYTHARDQTTARAVSRAVLNQY